MSFRVDCDIHQIFPVIFAHIRAVSPGTDLIRIKTGKCTCNGFLIRIKNNDLPEIVLAGKIEDGGEMIPADCDLPLVFQQACKAFPVWLWLEKENVCRTSEAISGSDILSQISTCPLMPTSLIERIRVRYVPVMASFHSYSSS